MKGTRPAAARLGTILLLLVPLAVSSTPPLPPPYYDYLAQGFVVRMGGGSLDNLAIQLFYTMSREGYQWRAFDAGGVALTRDDGSFTVTGRRFMEVDSLIAAVVYPDTMFWGNPVATGSPIDNEEELSLYTEEGFLCDDQKTSSHVVGYRFRNDSLMVTIP